MPTDSQGRIDGGAADYREYLKKNPKYANKVKIRKMTRMEKKRRW